MRVVVAAAALVLCGSAQVSVADVRGTVRFGVLPLELESSSDTPLFGADVDRAVAAYNAAATAYDRMHGGRTERIDAADLGLSATLVTISPGVELGTGAYFFRLEAPIGFGGGVRSVGVGVYPLNVQTRLSRGATLYGSLGGAASYLDREGDGDVGGLLAARAAAGLRFSHVVLEVGYNAFALGGSIDQAQIDAMIAARRLPSTDAVSAGEASGIVDVSVGVTF